MSMRQGILYRLTFENGKVYIGLTLESLERRVQRHISYARAGRQFALSCAIRRHGEDSFKAEVIGRGTRDELMRMEIDAIREHNALGCGGYNMTGGGDGSLGVSLDDVVKSRIATSLTGRKLSDAHRKRVSEVQKGKKISEETKERMRAAALKRVAERPNPLKGRKIPPEVIAKRVESRRKNNGGQY